MFRYEKIVNIAIKNVKKFYSVFFANKIREIESERQVFTVFEPPAEHECGWKTAHPYGFCAAFQPLNGAIFALEGLTFAKKEAPREKKALTFFHADIPFWKRGCSRKAGIWAKRLSVSEISNPSHFRVIFSKLSCREFWANLSHVERCFFVTFIKIFYASWIIRGYGGAGYGGTRIACMPAFSVRSNLVSPYPRTPEKYQLII